jgi:hypothetical protein
MKRTSPAALALLALGGGVVAFLAELAIAASGLPIIIPPISLSFTLVAIGVIVVLLAWPIHRAVRATVTVHIDPFRAMRVAVLAKASAFSGALFTGAGIGLLLYLLSRSVAPVSTSLWLAIAMAGGGLILLIAGLVAEYFCVLPPDDRDNEAPQPHGSHA